MKHQKYSDIPHGNTQKNVNKTVISFIKSIIDENSHVKILDVPCGKCEFLNYLNKIVDKKDLFGIDIENLTPNGLIRFFQGDLSHEFPISENEKFDIITCISGIMMFENTKYFLENCSNRLSDSGYFIITNDNVFTIRDRLSFLFFGHVRRFKLLFNSNETLTQYIAIQELQRLLSKCGIKIRKVFYTSFFTEDIVLIPLALLLYPLQFLYLKTRNNSISFSERKMLFPFKSLLFRHYVVIGQKC